MGIEIGTTIGDYQVVDVLGAGGMGQVYKVRNVISDRVEAMKILLPNLDTDQELAERFMREIKVQASLDHPNIAALHTAQRMGNQLLMIMEFVEGCTVESMMRQGRLPLRDSVDYVSQTLSALAYAHARGIIHRDIKPANMMVTRKGVLKLMDFGIAKMTMDHRLTQTGKTVGSLFYMSPEQIRGEANLDPRSDLYSLGITLYELSTGRRPFEGESDYSIMAAHLQQAPPPPIQIDPSLPSALNDIILMAIGKDPSQRFQTADAFKAALSAVQHGIGSGAGAAVPAGFSAAAAPPTPAHAAKTLPNRDVGAARRAPTSTEMPALGGAAPQQLPSQPYMQTPYQAPYQQQPQPMPMAFQQPQAPSPRSNRALYMIIGSLATVGVLVAGIVYGPKLWKTEGKGTTQQVAQVTTPSTTSTTTPAGGPVVQQPPVPQQTTTPPPQTTPSTAPQTTPQQTSPGQTTPDQPTQPPPVRRTEHPIPARQTSQPQPRAKIPPPNGMSGDPQTQPPPAMPQPRTDQQPQQPPRNAELEELNQQRMLMLPRIDAVTHSMKKLQQEQNRDGLGISGELIASHRRMGFFMETADNALRRGNVAEARTALNNAERELDKLENRFGR